MTTYFNWYELRVKANKDPTSILILTYALSVGYNKKIANRIRHLMVILKISEIPRESLKYFFQHTPERKQKADYSLYSKLKTIEPQSYFINSSFLKAKKPVIHKTNYIKLLSYRRIGDSSAYIYKDILTGSQLAAIKENPFVRVGDTKIYFTREFT